MTAALAVSDPELLSLISEQAADGSRYNIIPQTPWGARIVPLDADAPHMDGRRQYEEVLSYEGNNPWDDPTSEAVVRLIEREREELLQDVHEWNLNHRQLRQRPTDTTDYGSAPAFQAGMRTSMAPRHRGRTERQATANGRRSSRQQSKAKV